MNQGARDANAESAALAQAQRQDDILQCLQRIENLLIHIANNTNQRGQIIATWMPNRSGDYQ